MPLRWKDEWTPWFAAFCASCVVAIWLAGSMQFHCYDADSLVPKLTSTMEWSFFYWHTDRNGQLLPFLAMPFTHPLTNLVVQQWLGCRASDTRHRWELDRHGGTATVAHLARTPQPCGHSLDWIAKHLDLEIGDREESVGDLELYRFRLRDDRIARR